MKSFLLSAAVVVGLTAVAIADYDPSAQYPGSKNTGYDNDPVIEYPGAYDDQQVNDDYQTNKDDFGNPQYPNMKYPHKPQYPHQPNPHDQQWIAQEAYSATGGACDVTVNPHNYACTHWNYKGNQVFPLFELDWDNTLQGEWFSVTYVNPETGNNGPEFYMGTNPHNTLQPMGIINKDSNSQMGSMWIQGNSIVWNNWLGHTLATDPQTFRWLDAYTVEMQAYEGQYIHMFRCRDFNRNENHHLLCEWWLWYPQTKQWKNKGYMGFLTRRVWDNFVNGKH